MSIDTKNIRNVVMLGHSGSGKTTLAEAMLYESGAITRMGNVGTGNTISDYTAIEHERGNSLFSSLMHVKWRNCKINILDTPGFDDFIGEVVCSMKVADTALMVLNAAHGVEVGTEILWDYVNDFKTPTIFVISQMDHEKADFETTLEQAKERFGSKVMEVLHPLNQGTGFNAIIDAVRMVMYEFGKNGGKPEKKPIPESEMAKAMAMHNALVEAAAENDEGLMEKFFEQGTLSEEEMTSGLRLALAHQQIFPVFCCSALQDKGSGRIMGFINDSLPVNDAIRPCWHG